jgi:hypothetical protein
MTRPLIEVLLAEEPADGREALEQAAALVLLARCANPLDTMPAALKQRLAASASNALKESDSD